MASETAEERTAREDRAKEAEEWQHDFKALLLLNMDATKRISNTYRGRSSEIKKVMEKAVLEIRTAYFEAKAEAKATAQAKAQALAQEKAESLAQAKAQVLAQEMAK